MTSPVTIQVFSTNSTGKITVESNCTILHLKSEISKDTGAPEESIKITVDGEEVKSGRIMDYSVQSDIWLARAIYKFVDITIEHDKGEDTIRRVVYPSETLMKEIRQELMERYNLKLAETLVHNGTKSDGYNENKPMKIVRWHFKAFKSQEYRLIPNKYGLPHNIPEYIRATSAVHLSFSLSQVSRTVAYTIQGQDVVFADKQYVNILSDRLIEYSDSPDKQYDYINVDDGTITSDPQLGKTYIRTHKTRITIFCKLMCETKTFHVEPADKIVDLKKRIYDRTGIPIDQLRLIFAGTQLENHRYAAYYRLSDTCTIHQVLRLRGGGTCNFVDVSKSMTDMGFSRPGPSWRGCRKGLIIVAICLNESCKAFCDGVVHNAGHGTFDAEDLLRVPCPACRVLTSHIYTIGFFGCWWKWYGHKHGEEQPMYVPWSRAPDTGVSMVDTDGSTIKWDYLRIRCGSSTINDPNKLQSETCIICFDKQHEKDSTTLGCGHVFHFSCIEGWKMINKTCPICRQPICDKGRIQGPQDKSRK